MMRHLRNAIFGLSVFWGAVGAFAAEPLGRLPVGLGNVVSVGDWFNQEIPIAIGRIFRNVSPSDARPGAVIAAQTRNNPDYYYHWVRDAALTMEALISRYRFNVQTGAVKTQEQQILRRKMMEYFEFSEYIQNVPSLEGLGEPKYHVDGSAFNGPWGRPQNDGPALRALSLIHFAQILIDEGQLEFVRARFYNGKLPSGSVIKKDLEYVSHQWSKPSFDLWEEVNGEHFYTRMVQRRALLEGADFASAMGDSGAAVWYAKQARLIERDLENFWDAQRGYIIATRNRVGGLDYKQSQLDSAVILALLHGSLPDGFFSFRDPRVLRTMERMAGEFARIYSINGRTPSMAPAIGRYPEDRYGGSHFNAGNPWVLCTMAFAEAYYRMAQEFLAMGQSTLAQEYQMRGDAFVMRVQFHAHGDGSLNEQIDRNSGYMTSVEDLTWSYASVLTGFLARGR